MDAFDEINEMDEMDEMDDMNRGFFDMSLEERESLLNQLRVYERNDNARYPQVDAGGRAIHPCYGAGSYVLDLVFRFFLELNALAPQVPIPPRLNDDTATILTYHHCIASMMRSYIDADDDSRADAERHLIRYFEDDDCECAPIIIRWNRELFNRED